MSRLQGAPPEGQERWTPRALLAARFITFLETGVAAPGLFAPDLFTDFTMPLGRLQADSAEGSIALRAAGHPMVGRVPRSRLDVTGTGFVLEVEETWRAAGDDWYCREPFRADVTDGMISQLSAARGATSPSGR